MPSDRQPETVEQRQRIDKWLFFARAVKSRALATKLVAAGHVRVNRDKTDQPAKQIRPGDVLTISLEHKVLVWRVVAPGKRRGSFHEARLLYEDLSASAPEPPVDV